MTSAVQSLHYDGPSAPRPPMMIVGNSAAARSRAWGTADTSGFGRAAPLDSEQALASIAQTVHLSALWIEIDEPLSNHDRRFLVKADDEARRRDCGVVISTRLEHLDDVLSEVSATELEVVVDAGEIERVGALAVALAPRDPLSMNDVATDASAVRLRQLSEEVSRIASALSRLSAVPAGPPLSPATMAPPRADLPDVSAAQLRTMIRARRLRSNHLPGDLFADPAWDMLLDLLQAEIVQHRVPVSSLCIAAAVPATTALRWIKSMTDRGILLRRDDPHDGRRVFIEMAPSTSVALRRYFQEAGMATV